MSVWSKFEQKYHSVQKKKNMVWAFFLELLDVIKYQKKHFGHIKILTDTLKQEFLHQKVTKFCSKNFTITGNSPPPPRRTCLFFVWKTVNRHPNWGEFFSKGFTVVFGKKKFFHRKKLCRWKKVVFSKNNSKSLPKKTLNMGGKTLNMTIALTSLFFSKKFLHHPKQWQAVLIGSENRQSLGGVACNNPK